MIISHRGNIEGPQPENENSPEYIDKALKDGYDVEIDVWYYDNKFMLGHDKPQYEVDLVYLKNDRFWCHAKNILALRHLVENDIHCFFHQTDDVTLTSRGFLWTYVGKLPLTHLSICVLPEHGGFPPHKSCAGVCTDFVNLWPKIGMNY